MRSESAINVDPAVEATLPRIAHHHSLPAEGFVKLRQLVGGTYTRVRGGKVVAIVVETGVLPISKTTWLRGVAAGRFPRGIRRGTSTLYRVEEIRELLERLNRSEDETASGAK